MKYMVMECHPGYAVVLGEDGRFQKVANLNYQVGQLVEKIVTSEQPKAHSARKWIISSVSIAACLCVMVLAAWQMLWMPYGSIRIQINPEVQLTVNRMDDVVALEALNEDGTALIEGYDYKWKDMKIVSDELADRAVEMGYLSEGGTIHILVDSSHAEWKTHTQEEITKELEIHMGSSIIIELDDLDDLFEDIIEEEDDDDDDDDGSKAVISVNPSDTSNSEIQSDDDRDDDEDDQDDKDDRDDDDDHDDDDNDQDDDRDDDDNRDDDDDQNDDDDDQNDDDDDRDDDDDQNDDENDDDDDQNDDENDDDDDQDDENDD